MGWVRETTPAYAAHPELPILRFMVIMPGMPVEELLVTVNRVLAAGARINKQLGVARRAGKIHRVDP